MLFLRHHSFLIINYLLLWDSFVSAPCPHPVTGQEQTLTSNDERKLLFLSHGLPLNWPGYSPNLWRSQREVLEFQTQQTFCATPTKSSSGATELNIFWCQYHKQERHPRTESKCL